MGQDERTVVVRDAAQLVRPSSRRSFLKALGLGGTIVLLPAVFAACKDDGDPTGTTASAVTLNLSADIGIFQYAFVLEQLEAAFYTQIVTATTFAATFPSTAEQEMLTDIRNDEVIHREFLRAALGTQATAVSNIEPNFATIANDRTSLLTAARTFEDLGVAAYNGAGRYIRNENNLLMAGKIVSVEARHASAIRDVLDTTGTAFADLGALAALGGSGANALDGALAPSAVLTAAAPYVTTAITIGTQPS